ncbi:MAG: phosphate signaling complex protein PhoU [Streptococcaceae bacterium]|jgi:phosphate transport system protein|nr:phosphate signaling complex protein PhoU [Streptococcaceae bacterium]MCH4176082.1 phosphate signaling complex protein PhoU [Streptococcaceae bacterium]
MLRTQFEEQLNKLHNQFYSMGTQVSAQLNKAVRAFVSHDKDLAKEVIEADEEINELEIKLEKKSFEIIALQQPVSTDLRTVITVLKASSDLERMGDHAVSICKSTIHMKGEERLPEIEKEISIMGESVKKMLDAALNAYIQSDADRAREVATWDNKINKMFNEIRNHAISAIKENPETIVAGNDYLHVCTYLERIGDYSTNLCEWIVYLKTGKITELSNNNTNE